MNTNKSFKTSNIRIQHLEVLVVEFANIIVRKILTAPQNQVVEILPYAS